MAHHNNVKFVGMCGDTHAMFHEPGNIEGFSLDSTNLALRIRNIKAQGGDTSVEQKALAEMDRRAALAAQAPAPASTSEGGG